jgi:PilZ domain
MAFWLRQTDQSLPRANDETYSLVVCRRASSPCYLLKTGAIMGQTQHTLASHLFAIDRRRTDRSEVMIYSYAKLRGNRHVALEIGNVSPGGLMARTASAIAEQDRVQVDLPGIGWIPATVVWSIGDQYGFAFEKSLDGSFLESLLKMHRQH